MDEESYANDSGRRTRASLDNDDEHSLSLKSLMNEERIHALETLINVKIQSLEAVITAKAQAQAEAIVKAETAADKRFESVNEFRAQLNDLIRQFATKETVDSAVREQKTVSDSLLSNLHTLDRRLSNVEGKIVVYVSMGSFGATLLGGLFAWFGHTLH
jgi:CHASE3 domain sensor protein